MFFNQQTIDLHEGQGIYINPEVLHMIRDRYDPDAMFISLDVSPKLLTSFPNSVFERSYVKPVFCSSAADAVILDPGVFWQKKILDEAMRIEQDYKSRSFGWELAVSSSLYAIWKELVCHLHESLAEHDAPAADGARMRRNQRIKEILSYIREHFTEKITLDEIAKHLHLSTNECCRFFKKNMNCTLFEYITEYRLSKSMELLEHADLPVSTDRLRIRLRQQQLLHRKIPRKRRYDSGSIPKSRAVDFAENKDLFFRDFCDNPKEGSGAAS